MSVASSTKLSPASHNLLISYPQKRLESTPTTHRRSSGFLSTRKQLLAGSSAVIASSRQCPKGRNPRRSSRKTNVTIHVSPCNSPEPEKDIPSVALNNQLQPNMLVDDGVFLSPTVFQHNSPIQDSPTCQHPIPSSGFFYTPNRENPFLGRGTYGDVKLCSNKNHKFALKVIRPSSGIGEKNFIGVRHAHLVRILKVSELLNKVLICMEFAGHCNLQQLLDSKVEIDISCQVSFARQVASGLQHCHKLSIVHGDVKPANVIVSPTGYCKLGDFGHSVKLTSQYCAPKKHLPGTAAYAAPELLQGKRYTTSADIYSLGITMWQIYSREIPFAEEQHPHVIIYKVVKLKKRPLFANLVNETLEEYSEVATCCWHHDAERRPSATDVTCTLKKLLCFAV